MVQRHIQLFRNGAPATNDAFTTHAKVVEFLMGTGSPLNELGVKDGELVLYRYKLNDSNDIHTIVLAASVTGTGESLTKTFEVVANYDHLTNLITDLDATVRGTSDGQVSAIPTELTVSNNTGAYVAVEVVEKDGKITSVNVKENIDDTIKNAIEALDGTATIANVTDGVVTLKAGIVEADGIISNSSDNDITLAKVATTGDAADVDVATGIVGLDATNVQDALAELQGDIDAINDQTITAKENQAVQVDTAENGNTTIGLKLVDGEPILSQTAEGLKTNLTVDTKKYPTENTAEGYVAEKAGKTYIQIKGIGGEVISETDAAAFVKDGFLQEVELIEASEGQENVLRFTWNSNAGSQVTEIKVSDLCDVYTADETYLHLNGFKFEHKTVDGLDSTNAHGIISDVTVDSTTEQTFNVPYLQVDAAGHVITVDEKTVTIKLPTSIDTAVQTVTSTEKVNDTNKFVAVHATRAEDSNDIVLTSELKTQEIATAAAATEGTPAVDGLATALDVKTYVDGKIDALDESTTVVTNGVGIKVVDDGTGNDHKYTVSLVEVPRVDNPTTEGDPSTSSFADDETTFTYVKEVKTDGYGRVTGIVTETVTEDFDAGTY